MNIYNGEGGGGHKEGVGGRNSDVKEGGHGKKEHREERKEEDVGIAWKH